MANVQMHRTLEACNPEKKKTIEKKVRSSFERQQNNIAAIGLCFSTIVIPNLFNWPDDFRKSIEKSLIDGDTLSDLERSKVINWCRSGVTLYPLNTLRDGNCLLHAVSTFIWGIQDTALTLRQVLLKTLLEDADGKFKQRYMNYRSNQSWNNLIDDDSISAEWTQVIDSTTPTENANFGNPHVYLESIHIFVLANIIRRPIIVLAADKYRSIADQASIQENEIGGIYLPLELPPSQCNKSPVILGYCLSHFTPLVISAKPLTTRQKLAIPLQSKDLAQLPLKFLNSQEEHDVVNLTNRYLHLVDLVHSMEGSLTPLSGAKISVKSLPRDLDLINDYIFDSEIKYRGYLDREEVNPFVNVPIHQPESSESSRPAFETQVEELGGQTTNKQPLPADTRYFGIHDGNPSPETMHYFQNRKCVTVGCEMFGSAATGHMCSSCLSKYTQANTGPPSFHAEPTAPPPSMPIPESFTHESMMEHECETVGCKFKCSRTTQPFCHECSNKKQFRQISHNSSSTEEKRRLSAEMENPIIIGSLPKENVRTPTSCGESELYGVGAIASGNIQRSRSQPSSPLHSQNERKQAGATSPMALHGEYSNATVHKSEEINRKALVKECEWRWNSSPSLSSPVRSGKYICSTPGCVGIRMNNNAFEMCYSCAEKNSVIRPTSGENTSKEPLLPKPQRASHGIQELGAAKGSIEDNLVESATPTAAIIEPPQVACNEEYIKCASPVCGNSVSVQEKLCQECLDVLRKNQAKISKNNSTCKTTGCTFHGSVQTKGYCSDCYKNIVQKVHSAPVAARNQYQVEQQLSEKSNTAPMARGRKCIVGDCTRYGEPATENMCSRCYFGHRQHSAPVIQNVRGYNLLAPKSSPSRNVPSKPVSSPRPPRWNDRLQQVENSQKVKIPCKSTNCDNYGNASCEGFCNGCYRNYRRQFPRSSVTVQGDVVG